MQPNNQLELTSAAMARQCGARSSTGCYADTRRMSEASPSIDAVWARLKAHEGEEFRTKKGLSFTYVISGDVFRPSRTDYSIPRSEFAKALAHVPFDGPGAISHV